MTLTLEILPGPDELAARVVEIMENAALEALADGRVFHTALSGGSTPKAAYRLWGKTSTLDWSRVHLWFGDERCVPPHHPDSNAGMVEAALLSQLTRPPEVSRMRGEDPDPENAARDYGRALKKMMDGGGRIDLALMGIGNDGHTASLFPGRPAVGERHHLCVSTLAADGVSPRITLTVPAFQRAGVIVFLASGADKAGILREVLQGPVHPEKYPSQHLLRDEALPTLLLLDQAAAQELG